jgi:hypothetical protein
MDMSKLNELPGVDEEVDEMEMDEPSEYGVVLDEEGLMLAKAAGFDSKKAEALKAFVEYCLASGYAASDE